MFEGNITMGLKERNRNLDSFYLAENRKALLAVVNKDIESFCHERWAVVEQV
jgi:hypothetical protein